MLRFFGHYLRGYLGWIAILLIGFVILVAVFPAATVDYTVKRGYFKLFPIMIWYMGGSRALSELSVRLRTWENG